MGRDSSPRLEQSIWSKLPDDLLVEILCRVPEKPLIRLKCVSKTWNTLISHVCVPRISPPSHLWGILFRARDRRNNDNRFLGYISLFDIDWRSDFSIPPLLWYGYNRTGSNENKGQGFVESCIELLPFKPTAQYFLDCCNGLLLFVRGSVPDFYVCNPTTKQCVSIPDTPPHNKQSTDAVLAFNPCESVHYRVVRFACSGSCTSVSNPPRLDIFYSKTREWVTHTVPVEPPAAYGAPWIRRSIYLNGVLYRLSSSKHLLCFDLKKSAVKATTIKLPEKEKTDGYGSMGVSMGCFYYANHDTSKMLIWLLEDSCKTAEWVLKHIIPFHKLTIPPVGKKLHLLQNSPWFKPYAFDPTSGLIFIGISTFLFSYDPTTGNMKRVCSLGTYMVIDEGQYSVFPYSPCSVVLA